MKFNLFIQRTFEALQISSQNDILAGSIYAVGIDDMIMVKRREKHPGKLVLRSDNKVYEPIYLSTNEMDSFRIIGKAVWVSNESSVAWLTTNVVYNIFVVQQKRMSIT
jgi:hypothetical protein